MANPCHPKITLFSINMVLSQTNFHHYILNNIFFFVCLNFVLACFYFGFTSSSAQGLLLRLCSAITHGVFKRPYVVPEIEPGQIHARKVQDYLSGHKHHFLR